MFVAIVFFAAAGGLLVYAGVMQRSAVPVDDPEAYLRSLDHDLEESDEFTQLLSEPFLTRVLRPLGSRALGSIAGLLPLNYRDDIRQKLVYAGWATKYRPEKPSDWGSLSAHCRLSCGPFDRPAARTARAGARARHGTGPSSRQW